MMPHPESITIIGGGLAGCTLAWQLHWRGVPFTIVDRDGVHSSSKIAAGLMTPITGKRLAKSWRYDEFFAAAVTFYRQVEAAVGETIFQPRVIARLFIDAAERERYLAREHHEFLGHVQPLHSLPEGVVAPLGGFEMPQGGQLHVAKFLEVTRRTFADRFTYQEPRTNTLLARVYCEGYQGRSNPSFPQVPFRPAKGDILTLRIPNLVETRVLNLQGTWLVSLGEELFRAGSTYDWHDLTPTPSESARDEILANLRRFVHLPLEVLEHHAAVRPIVHQQRPALGVHPHDSRIALFNGLSSKGSLWAPLFAAQLADAILGRGAIDAEVDVRRFFRH
jgi:glycine oxidase